MVSGTPKSIMSSRLESVCIRLMYFMAFTGFSEETGIASMEPPAWVVTQTLPWQ